MKAFILAVAAMLTGCGAAGGASREPTLVGAPGAATAVATPVCTGRLARATALLVDLDPAAQTALQASMKNGVVLVEYDCATLRVLPYCRVADGAYELTAVNQARVDAVRATTVDAVAKQDLVGSCDGATHFVASESLASLSPISVDLIPLGVAGTVAVTRSTCASGDANACLETGELERACTLGSAQACGDLGERLLVSDGATKLALTLLDRACAGHATGSCLALAKTLATRSPERAFRAAGAVCGALKGAACDQAISIAITTGHANEGFAWSEQVCPTSRASCENLGDLYERGVGTARNPAKAREMWSMACQWGKPSGSRSACEKLGLKRK